MVTAPRQVLDCTSPAMSFHVSPADGHPAALSCWGGTVCAEAECAARDGALGTHTAPEVLWDGAVLGCPLLVVKPCVPRLGGAQAGAGRC